MPKVTYVSATGDVRVVDGEAGASVMDTAVRNGVPGIVGDCGGSLSCATCHVYVDEADLAKLGPVGAVEDEMLEGTMCERLANSRLSCQIALSDEIGDLRVTTPEEQQ